MRWPISRFKPALAIRRPSRGRSAGSSERVPGDGGDITGRVSALRHSRRAPRLGQYLRPMDPTFHIWCHARHRGRDESPFDTAASGARMRRAQRMSRGGAAAGSRAARRRRRAAVGDAADGMGRVHRPVRGDRSRGGARPRRRLSRLDSLPRRRDRHTRRPAVRDRSAAVRSGAGRGARGGGPVADARRPHRHRLDARGSAVRHQRHQPGGIRRQDAGKKGSRRGADRRQGRRAHGGTERRVHTRTGPDWRPHLRELRQHRQCRVRRPGRIDAADHDRRGRRSIRSSSCSTRASRTICATTG
jgi:hypothetical protein